ncbi:MAG: rod shape-determining protein MreC [Bdellovibrionota bacterium]
MNFVNYNLKKVLIILVVLALPLISINIEQKSARGAWFNEPFVFAAQSVQNLFFGLSQGVRTTTSHYINILNIKSKNIQLQKENDELKTRLGRFTENTNELERLRTLLDFQKNTKMELIPAQVIGRNLVTDHNTITINKGLSHGLRSGQAVLTVSGAVGYVFKPSSKSAHVMLITDRYSVIDALIQKNRAHGLIEGKTKDTCVLQYVEHTEDIKDGDLIVTGGLDNIFPKGFPLGVIANIERRTNSASLNIEVKPVVDANKVEEVFVVKSNGSENFLNETESNDKTSKNE